MHGARAAVPDWRLQCFPWVSGGERRGNAWGLECSSALHTSAVGPLLAAGVLEEAVQGVCGPLGPLVGVLPQRALNCRSCGRGQGPEGRWPSPPPSPSPPSKESCNHVRHPATACKLAASPGAKSLPIACALTHITWPPAPSFALGADADRCGCAHHPPSPCRVSVSMQIETFLASGEARLRFQSSLERQDPDKLSVKVSPPRCLMSSTTVVGCALGWPASTSACLDHGQCAPGWLVTTHVRSCVVPLCLPLAFGARGSMSGFQTTPASDHPKINLTRSPTRLHIHAALADRSSSWPSQGQPTLCGAWKR